MMTRTIDTMYFQMPFISFRMFIATLMSALGLIAVANAKREWQAIAGIVITSFSCGLGESSLMTYAPNFNR